MTDTAQLMEIRVTSGNPDVGQMYTLNPPIEGDDGNLYEFGAAMQTGGIADVFAATPAGGIIKDVDGLWVSLLNAPLLERRCWTIDDLFGRFGYEVRR